LSLLKHVCSRKEASEETKCKVFSNYRDTIAETTGSYSGETHTSKQLSTRQGRSLICTRHLSSNRWTKGTPYVIKKIQEQLPGIVKGKKPTCILTSILSPAITMLEGEKWAGAEAELHGATQAFVHSLPHAPRYV